jgi:mono/diheme cytochrome c family protein
MGWVLSTRTRVVVSTLVVLGLLDLGRSLYARVGYARPTEVWQPLSSLYADLSWPPGVDLPATASLGEHIYAQRCAVCHGPDGRGNGPAAPSMIPRPRDFSRGEFKYKSTPFGQPPTDQDLIQTVRDGLPGGAMPYWRDLLSDQEIRAVVDHIKKFSPVFAQPSAQALVISPRVPPDKASMGRGQTLYQTMCASCHGADGRLQAELKDSKGYPVIARDLTAPWTFRGGSAPEQIWLRITTGLPPAPMPPFREAATPQQRWDLVNYVLSLARTPPWEPGGHLGGPGYQADPTRRGGYLVHASVCGLCHTPINRTGIYRGDDYYLAGGMRVGVYPHGVFISRNLTSDAATGLGQWADDEIIRALRTGVARDRILNFFDMPWTSFHRLQTDDARAIASYLKTTLPSVRQPIAGPLHYGVIETIVTKIARGLPAALPQTLTFANGMFTARPFRQDWPARFLIAAQWAVLVAGIILYRRTPHPSRRGRRWLRVLGLLGLVLLGAIGWAVYALPTLRIIPPEQLVTAASPAPPVPDPARLKTAEQAALAERGRYLFSVTPCVLCHGNTGNGGTKISWKPFGTLWVKNITPDPTAGIGTWTDGQIARAIRSGVSADGHTLHWQGMPWDHFSNLDEEDVRSLIVYLRALPPVTRLVPSDRPPAADDCDTYTFWIVPSASPGCR